MVAHYIRGI